MVAWVLKSDFCNRAASPCAMASMAASPLTLVGSTSFHWVRRSRPSYLASNCDNWSRPLAIASAVEPPGSVMAPAAAASCNVLLKDAPDMPAVTVTGNGGVAPVGLGGALAAVPAWSVAAPGKPGVTAAAPAGSAALGDSGEWIPL